MLISFKNKNVGPMANRELRFAPHLNVFTGDNSLGKSFLLDMIWFGLTRKWPHTLNPLVDGGFPARPADIRTPASLTYELETMAGNRPGPFTLTFDKELNGWKSGRGRKPQPGLVIYAMADGSFAVWDPILNYWNERDDEGTSPKVAAYVLSRTELWPGDPRQRSAYCKGVIEGWAAWQRDKNDQLFSLLREVVRALVPEKDQLEIGELESLPLVDGGDQPMLKFRYGTVRLQYASAAVRRMSSLAYVLVWAVSQHLAAAKSRGLDSTHNVVLLFDEIEAHLHPRWQRSIVSGILGAVPKLCEMAGLLKNELQMFVSTHSPLVMTALEDEFNNDYGDEPRDKWFDFDLSEETRQVEIEEADFAPRGSAENWLRSRAFDLASTYSPEVEKLLEEVNQLLYPSGNVDCGAADRNARANEILYKLRDRLPVGSAVVRRLTARLDAEDMYVKN